jgi:DNA-binding CsgD family transcriptional regulator
MPYATDTRLPQLFADTVRMLTAGWTDDFASRLPGIAVPVPFLALRVHPMSGASGWCTGVTIQRLRQENALIHAAAHYRISPRELQVLARLLQGSSLAEIAQTLTISSSTVQDHIKRLIEKTRSGNRSEMIANMFRHDTTA